MSRRINWKKQLVKIPSQVQVAPKVYYQVVWQKDLADSRGNFIFGLTDLDNKIITIRMDMKPRITVETYWHELQHAFSEEHKINLTENQVLRSEHTLPYLLMKNNVWNDE